MPGRDGMGPIGSGRGRGYQFGSGGERGRRGGSGNTCPEFCECSQCGTKVKHQRGEPCIALKCPQCGSAMVRSMSPMR